MNLLSKIKSNSFALWVAILSVVVQSFHSYTAFYNTSSLKGSGWGIAQAVLFAVVIDLAILFYTVRNKTKVALGAAFVMVVINSYYYYQHLGLSFQFIFGVFLALTIPTSVYFYSEEIKDETDPFAFLKAEIKSLQDVIYNGKKENERLVGRLHDGDANLTMAEHKHRLLQENYDEAIRLRDMAIQSESMARQELAKIIKGHDPRFNGSMNAEGPKDKSLVNIQDDDKILVSVKDGKIISTTIPDDTPYLPNIE